MTRPPLEPQRDRGMLLGAIVCMAQAIASIGLIVFVFWYVFG